MGTLDIAILAFTMMIFMGIFLYFRPGFLREGFATLAVDEVSMPKCFLRDTEAQQILADFRDVQALPPASDAHMAFEELKLIMQKMLCMDADITGSGAGFYSTYSLPYGTAHDIEPAASFVGRCLRNAIRERDIEVAMDKFSTRGHALIDQMCHDPRRRRGAHDKFQNVLIRTTKQIQGVCLKPQAQMDIPAGPRDPGYYVPESIKDLRPYTIMGGKQYI